MTATIIPFPGAQRARLVWQRRADRAWELVDQAGAVWATIEPYGDGERHGRGMFALPTVKAIAGDYWCLASCVSQGKRRIEAKLYLRNLVRK